VSAQRRLVGLHGPSCAIRYSAPLDRQHQTIGLFGDDDALALKLAPLLRLQVDAYRYLHAHLVLPTESVAYSNGHSLPGSCTKRVIAYYELESTQPPGAMLADLASALGVAVDELLGTKPLKEKPHPRTARLRKRLQRVEDLPAVDQKAVLKFVDALVQSRNVSSGTRRRGSSRK
jgi:hypothetical protein